MPFPSFPAPSPTLPASAPQGEGLAKSPSVSPQDLFAQHLLKALRAEMPSDLYSERGKGFKLAVVNITCAIEDRYRAAGLDHQLWSCGILPADLKPTHRIGEHLNATRLHCGLIP